MTQADLLQECHRNLHVAFQINPILSSKQKKKKKKKIMSNEKKKKEKRKMPYKFVCGASFVQLTSVRLAVAVSLSGGLTVEACEAPGHVQTYPLVVSSQRPSFQHGLIAEETLSLTVSTCNERIY